MERRVAIVRRGDVGGGEVARLVLVVGSGRILTDALPFAFVDFGDDGIADRATTLRFTEFLTEHTQRVIEKRYALGEKLRRVGRCGCLIGSWERWCYIFCVCRCLKFSLDASVQGFMGKDLEGWKTSKLLILIRTLLRT